MNIWNLFKKKKNEHKKPMTVKKKLDLPQIKKYKIGDKIGGQYLVHKIFGGEGKSGMGVIYLVTSDKFDFPFVLKTYQKTSDLNQKRFVKEIETWVALGSHPNIVRTFGAQWIDLQLFILAEYIQFNENGRNILTDYLKNDKISYENIIKWSVQFCYGMDHAVNSGLIAHRDIKPDNLMITRDLNLKITDFGLSKISDYTDIISHSSKNQKTNSQNYTKTDSFMGTALYVAPEQIRNSKDVDYRADIYSFGIILYQMISGGQWVYDIPKQSSDILGDLLKAHLSSKPNSLKSPFMPIIEKCLNKKKENRYQTFKELLNDLEILAKRLSITSPTNLVNITQNTEELYVKANSYVRLGENEKALHFINEYLTNQPHNHSALNLKGTILTKLNRIDEALDCYLKAIEIYPSDTSSLHNIGLLYYINKKDFNKAIEYFKKSIEYDKSNVGTMMSLSGVYLQTNNYEEACNLLITAIQLQPQNQIVLSNVKSTLNVIIKNKFVCWPAVELIDLLTQIDSSNKVYFYNIGVIYFSNKMYWQALSCFQQAEEILPDDVSLLFFIVLSHRNSKEYEEALKYCDKLISKNLERKKATLIKGNILATLKRFDEAILLIENEFSNSSRTDDYYFYLAEIFEMQGNFKKSIDYLNSAKNYLIKKTDSESKSNLLQIEKKLNELKLKIDK